MSKINAYTAMGLHDDLNSLIDAIRSAPCTYNTPGNITITLGTNKEELSRILYDCRELLECEMQKTTLEVCKD